MTMIERVADAIDEAQIGYSISLTRLVDLVATYECRVDGVDGVLEFGSHSEALEFVTARRRETQARAAIEALREPTEWMLDCGACYEDPDGHYTKGPMKEEGDLSKDVWSAMIDAALKEST